MSSDPATPIVLISGFKAGTWLMREIVTGVTGLPFYEPPIIPGKRKYFDPGQLHFVPGHFYSWHLVPVEEVCDALNKNQAHTIFVVRNIYDVVVSIYFHFLNNIDEDIDRGANKHSFLRKFSFGQGLSLMITGFDEQNVRWNGMVEVLEHYNEIFKTASLCKSIIINYDNLVKNKTSTIQEITHFLEIPLLNSDIETLAKKTSFSTMKTTAQKKQIGKSHFREGKPATNRNKLSEYHFIQLRQIINLYIPDLYFNAEKVDMQDIIRP